MAEKHANCFEVEVLSPFVIERHSNLIKISQSLWLLSNMSSNHTVKKGVNKYSDRAT